jgi:YfiH family protein
LALARSVGRAQIRFTAAADGDLRTDASARARIHPAPWSLLHQVHGSRVVVVDAPGAHAGEDADAAVTRVDDAPLVVMTADCAPVALVAGDGEATVVAVAHAGWRGLVAGVIRRTVDAMRLELGDDAAPVAAVVGPCIHAECYEFGGDDLDAVAHALGDDGVRARTRDGRPALDVPAAVTAVLRDAGVHDTRIELVDVCTSCNAETHWSHRARGDVERQGVLVWRSASTS